ncbi:hypothetical protein CQW23_13434 [Capsicum baccatum]|uniref:Uncharacterized protein n=1 Tax=Capsicum baccatum TaxID=33114 RepID=A0A2G2WVE0_CAPBA|nr:hypothetical protein CQW23_13434 [Capsicum baccatum]
MDIPKAMKETSSKLLDTFVDFTFEFLDQPLLPSQVLKKDENINQVTNDLQECMKECGVVKGILPKVFRERDFMWEEVKSYSEMNMLLNYEINMLKKKVDILEKVILMKEGQITIMKDWIGKPLDLLASPDSLLE